MNRRLAREKCFGLIFEKLFKDDNSQISKEYCLDYVGSDEGLDEIDNIFIMNTVNGVFENKDILTETIIKFSKGFAINRIYKVDLAILYLAIYEIKFCDDIPNAVSCNEAVELCHKFSTSKSYSFVNGILSSVVKEAK